MASFRSLVALAALSLVQNVHAWNIDLPICTEPFQPFVYSGCYQDLKSPNALIFRSDLDSQNMTVELCVAECKGNGYRYAGLEYYGECYCGTSVNGPQVDESQCSFPCTGNKSETCGGNSLISIWQDTTFPTEEATIADYVSLGCYTDDSDSGRTLSYPMDNVNSSTMTTETCLDACKDAGFPYAGTEYGGECWCGVVVGNFSTSAPSDECSIACKGDSSQLCGGRSRLNLYVAKDLESLQPCGYVPSSSSSSVLPPTSSTTSVSSTSPTSSVPTSSKPATSSQPVTSSTKSSTKPSSTTSCKETTTSKPPVKTSSTSTKKTSTTTSCKETTTSKPVKTSSTSTKKSSTTTSCKETTTSKPVKTSSTSTKKSSTTTSCKETTTSKPVKTSSTSTKKSSTTPCTTSKGQPPKTTSTKSPSTTSKPATTKPPVTTTSSAALCTTTVTIPSTCEYGCGKWCSDEIPDFDDVDGCKSGSSHCKLQVAACFKNAGWPGAMDCFDFSSWCSDIGSYCTSSPSRGGKCSKGDAWKSKPPKGGKPPTTTTSVYPCKPTSTSSTKKITSTTSSTTSKCPVPTATGICKQPTNKQWGYAPGSPVGDIDLPILTCNDLKEDFSKYPFKLYTDSDSKKCGGYPRPSVPNACADACKTQYDQCQDTYATGCKEKNGSGSGSSGGSSGGFSSWWPFWKRSAFPGSYFDYIKAPNKRTFGWTDNYSTATQKCTAQYNDCLSQNKGVSAGSKCTSYGYGW